MQVFEIRGYYDGQVQCKRYAQDDPAGNAEFERLYRDENLIMGVDWDCGIYDVSELTD